MGNLIPLLPGQPVTIQLGRKIKKITVT